MADHITLINIDNSSQADRIMDRFEQETGLEGERTEDGRTYTLESEEHELDVVQTLTAIDEAWTEHVGFQDPA